MSTVIYFVIIINCEDISLPHLKGQWKWSRLLITPANWRQGPVSSHAVQWSASSFKPALAQHIVLFGMAITCRDNLCVYIDHRTCPVRGTNQILRYCCSTVYNTGPDLKKTRWPCPVFDGWLHNRVLSQWSARSESVTLHNSETHSANYNRKTSFSINIR